MLRKCEQCAIPFAALEGDTNTKCHHHRKKSCVVCKVMFTHPTSAECAVCGGRACPECGTPKPLNKDTCGKQVCVSKHATSKYVAARPNVYKFK